MTAWTISDWAGGPINIGAGDSLWVTPNGTIAGFVDLAPGGLNAGGGNYVLIEGAVSIPGPGTVRRSTFISRSSGSRLFQRSACQAWW